jgi:hypothetical protein
MPLSEPMKNIPIPREEYKRHLLKMIKFNKLTKEELIRINTVIADCLEELEIAGKIKLNGNKYEVIDN